MQYQPENQVAPMIGHLSPVYASLLFPSLVLSLSSFLRNEAKEVTKKAAAARDVDQK